MSEKNGSEGPSCSGSRSDWSGLDYLMTNG
ncbi:rCG50923 [Rattus norvegicus]|uniref:RCG50923 n=1 Tax=Rattus norvegicus TaxID=10116 RepID=A6KJ59_RAT|nr:rCG50923 [Rattus norvegicus]